MPMTLNGSNQTGSKIMKNLGKFECEHAGKEDNTYKFNWIFDNYQKGMIVISMNGKDIDESSTINCTDNIRDFRSSLGLYKDSLFNYLIESVTNTKYNLFYIYVFRSY